MNIKELREGAGYSNVHIFTYQELRLATKQFRPDFILGEGGFGHVYKGWIDEHTYTAAKPGSGMVVAVKRLKPEGFQGHKEWLVSVCFLGPSRDILTAFDYLRYEMPQVHAVSSLEQTNQDLAVSIFSFLLEACYLDLIAPSY
jgi:hypothetical protein